MEERACAASDDEDRIEVQCCSGLPYDALESHDQRSLCMHPRLGHAAPFRPPVLLALVLASGALALVLSISVYYLRPAAVLQGSTEATVGRIEEDLPNKQEDICGEVLENVEFHTRSTIYWVGNMYSQEMCCAECNAHPECRAWTYGKQKDMPGLTRYCYLKRLEDNEEPQQVEREGVVSGLTLIKEFSKHGIVANMLAENSKGHKHENTTARTMCPGPLNVTGYGPVSVVSAMWRAPDEPAALVEVPYASWAIIPHFGGRAYFASNCTYGTYNSDKYTSWKLLGGTLRYTIDMSRAGCGCNAQFHLVPMRQNTDESRCHDFSCGHGEATCGVQCAEIGLQDANQYAWSSSLNLPDDDHGPSWGYGGGKKMVGRRDWTSKQYGPGGECIDTSWPFEVEASFPVDDRGKLKAVEVTLSQEGHSCPLKLRMDKYNYKATNGLDILSEVLAAGVTPSISYHGSDNLGWLDGEGTDAQGPCVEDAPEACPSDVRFYDFAIEHTIGEKEAPNETEKQEPLMQAAINTLHVAQAKKAREAVLASVNGYEETARLQAFLHSGKPRCVKTDAEKPVTDGDAVDPPRAPAVVEDCVEEDEHNTEWEVVADRVHVRSRQDPGADVLKDALKGEIIFGKKADGWIKLAFYSGFVQIEEGGDVFLEERLVVYEKIVTGSCTDAGMFPIDNIMVCKVAAFALGYLDSIVEVYKGKQKRPQGCHVVDGELWLSANEADKGNGATGGGEPVCSSRAYQTTTTTTTSTTTTRTTTSTVTTTWGYPSLFCVEVVRLEGYEFPLAQEQLKRGASIFSCDEFAVFSGGEEKFVGTGPTGLEIKTILIPPIEETVGDFSHGDTTNSWLNTKTFLQVWELAQKDGRYRNHHWTVKVDPDAVFFPDRLRWALKPHTFDGGKLFVMNCARYNPVALYGSIEVFSKGAIDAYLWGQSRCRNELPWHGWGEDYFMSHCMDLLGVGRLYDFELLSDKRCTYRPCWDKSRVVYHDYKDADPNGAWFQCWKQAGGGP